jgi:hypothetical protein
MIRSRASVPIAENISAYLTTRSLDLLVWVMSIFLYLQNYGFMSTPPSEELRFRPTLAWRHSLRRLRSSPRNMSFEAESSAHSRHYAPHVARLRQESSHVK